jgi:geranylgeranyl diphosphate synthase type II
MDIQKYLEKKKKIVDNALNSYLPAGRDPSGLTSAMRYSLFSNAKRIRPILAIAAAGSCGGKQRTVLPAACAIELIHTFTLIHDDLPGIDNSDLRRGRPSCHKAFNEATALLAGDALCVLAFEVILKYTDKKVEAKMLLAALREISQASGLNGVVAGEVLDIKYERSKVDLSELKRMYALKTGALIKAAVRCGAILSKASKPQLKSLTSYADHLGLAFQIADDILDVVGNTKLTGKPAGLDKLRGKATYPRLIGVDKAKTAAQSEISAALNSIKGFGGEADPLRAIADFVVKRQM